MRVAAVVLCAGGGRRFNVAQPASGGPQAGRASHKLLAPLKGRPLVAWAVGNAIDAHLDLTIVVTGAVDLSTVLPSQALVVNNQGWAGGLATSLAVGLTASRHHGCDAAVVGLGDQPLVPAAAWSAVASVDAPIVVATYDGVRAHPVRLSAGIWDALPSHGEVGARSLMRSRPELVVEVACPGSPLDVDTAQALSYMAQIHDPLARPWGKANLTGGTPLRNLGVTISS